MQKQTFSAKALGNEYATGVSRPAVLTTKAFLPHQRVTTERWSVIEQLKFYMTQASPELLQDRREYIERVIVGKLKRGIEEQKQWSLEMRSQPDSIELIDAYEAGLKFFTKLGFAG